MRLINTINSIEIASICNNNCSYCPAGKQSQYRTVGLMKMDIFEKTLEWVEKLRIRGTQRELNLFGVGEPTLHPLLPVMIKKAKDVMPINGRIHLNTNGILMTEELATQCKDAGISNIDITAHDPKVAKEVIEVFKKVGIVGQVSLDFATSPNNWAGNVNWTKKVDYTFPCNWLGTGQVMVMSDGNITTCCIDAFAKGVFTNVNENILEAEMKPHKLCTKCHHIIPAEFRELKSNLVTPSGQPVDAIKEV